jgi:hypothetical protein
MPNPIECLGAGTTSLVFKHTYDYEMPTVDDFKSNPIVKSSCGTFALNLAIDTTEWHMVYTIPRRLRRLLHKLMFERPGYGERPKFGEDILIPNNNNTTQILDLPPQSGDGSSTNSNNPVTFVSSLTPSEPGPETKMEAASASGVALRSPSKILDDVVQRATTLGSD